MHKKEGLGGGGKLGDVCPIEGSVDGGGYMVSTLVPGYYLLSMITYILL